VLQRRTPEAHRSKEPISFGGQRLTAGLRGQVLNSESLDLALVFTLIEGLSVLQIAVGILHELLLASSLLKQYVLPYIVALTEQSVCTSLWLARPQAHILSNWRVTA
jgi:hypothetical protein